jgi:HEPN domain-containing protein
VRKAEADYQFAARAARRDEPFRDMRCLLCQQSAEKYLKALLAELGQPIPRTHVLRDLLGLLVPHHPSVHSYTRGAKFLTRFAVAVRYPGQRATKRQADAALRWAGRVRATCRAILGLPPPRRPAP